MQQFWNSSFLRRKQLYLVRTTSRFLKKLCALEEGLKMAEATLFRVTEEERRIARELSEQYYYDPLADKRAEGKEEGAYKTKLETAATMKALNYPLDDIHKITGLSEAEIVKL